MDVKNWFYNQRVTEAEMDEAFSLVEEYTKDFAINNALYGITKGIVASLGSAPTVDITKGAAFDQLGRMIPPYTDGSSTKNHSYALTTAGASTAVVSGGNERWISIFAKYGRKTSDTRTDGNGASVDFDVEDALNSNGTNAGADKFYILVGTEAALGAGVRPSLQSDCVLVCDIKRTFADGANVLDTTRREDYVVASGTPRSLRTGNVLAALTSLLGFYNNHVNTGTADRHGGGDIDLASGSSWPDGTTNPSGTLITRLNKIITDLIDNTGSTADGASRIGADARGSNLAQGTVGSQLTWLEANTIKTGVANIFSALNTFTGGITHDGSSGADFKVLTNITGGGALTEAGIQFLNDSGAAPAAGEVLPIMEVAAGASLGGARVYLGPHAIYITINARVSTYSTTSTWVSDYSSYPSLVLALHFHNNNGSYLTLGYKSATGSAWNASAWTRCFHVVMDASAGASVTPLVSATNYTTLDVKTGTITVNESGGLTHGPFYFGGEQLNYSAGTASFGGYMPFRAPLASAPVGGTVTSAAADLSATNSGLNGSPGAVMSAVDPSGYGFRWTVNMAAGPGATVGYFKVSFTD